MATDGHSGAPWEVTVPAAIVVDFETLKESMNRWRGTQGKRPLSRHTLLSYCSLISASSAETQGFGCTTGLRRRGTECRLCTLSQWLPWEEQVKKTDEQSSQYGCMLHCLPLANWGLLRLSWLVNYAQVFFCI